jgi:hypothetical protein
MFASKGSFLFICQETASSGSRVGDRAVRDIKSVGTASAASTIHIRTAFSVYWARRQAGKPAAEGRRSAIGPRLIEHAVAPRAVREGGDIGLLRDLEGVEAGPQQKQELVAQDLAGGAQLAAKPEPLAQDARLAVGTAVLEAGKSERDLCESVEMGCKLRDAAIVGPEYAYRALVLRNRVCIGR